MVVPPAVGAEATLTLDPIAGDPTMSGDQPVSGSGTFRATREGVDFTFSFLGCVQPNYYAARFYDAPDCLKALAEVGHGDEAARDGVSKIACNGTTGFARVWYSRPNTDPRPWTIANTPSDGNVVGKVVVLESRDPPFQAFACGKVMRAPDEPPEGPLPAVGVSAELAGMCTWKSLQTTSSATCPDVAQVVDCADTHCELAKCVAPCADHVACVEGLADPCDAMTMCPSSDACNACQVDIANCMTGFCLPTLACGPKATPGGPCSTLEECCSTQGTYAEGCLDAVHLLEQFGGDANCSSAMNDWDFVTHLHVPCTF